MKLTQSQFAELVNLSEDAIGKIERGSTIPTIETLYKIANGLKLPMEELLSPLPKKALGKPSKTLTDLINYLKTRSDEDIRLIHELAVKIFEKRK
jgi:transcriptional regulator with XRE-family HTH domain